MNKIQKYIWRAIQRRKGGRLSKKNVVVAKTVVFDENTMFGGFNKIGRYSLVIGSSIGRYSYMGAFNQLDNVEIGNFCSIGSNLKVITSTHPSREFVSTHPAFFSTLKQDGNTFVTESHFNEILGIRGRKLIIGHDVWIGDNVTFMGGVTIGNGAIIGANALVTKDVPPYAIVGGVPAKLIRYRFTKEQIETLESFKWWNKDDKWLKTNVDFFQSISEFINRVKEK